MIYRFSWHFPADHPALAGHFPGQPIAPGAVLLDRLQLFAGRVPALGDGPWRIERAKFVQTARPGDTLAFVLETTQAGTFAFRIERDASLIAHGLFAVTPALST